MDCLIKIDPQQPKFATEDNLAITIGTIFTIKWSNFQLFRAKLPLNLKKLFSIS
jgi:hypothetical protein